MGHIDANDYDGLRRAFPALTQNHAVLHLLTDHSLTERGTTVWKSAIKEAMFPTIAPDAPKHSRVLSKTNRFGGRGRRNSLFAFGAPGVSRSKQHPGMKMQKNSSAPHF